MADKDEEGGFGKPGSSYVKPSKEKGPGAPMPNDDAQQKADKSQNFSGGKPSGGKTNP